MFELDIGNKLVCDNGHTYTLVAGNGFYTFGVANESGEIVDYVMEYYLKDCLPLTNQEFDNWQDALCVGEDDFGNLEHVYILNVIK